MHEEGSLFDVPPAAIGRYLVRQPLGTGTTGSVFHGVDPETQETVAIKLFKVDVSPDGAHEVAVALARLVSHMPRPDALAVPLDAGLDEIDAFFVTAFVEGDSLDSALRDYGPVAIDDLVPRLQRLADGLDAVHRAGFVHGALHPRDILVSAETTHVTGVGVAPILANAGVAWPIRRPYAAPEVVAGAAATAASDQFSLAAIAFEWLFGRPISGPAERKVEVRALPGVDRETLSGALTSALAPEPGARFESCRAFSDAVARAVDRVASSPLDVDLLARPVDDAADPVEPFIREPVSARFEPMAPPHGKPMARFGGGMLVITFLVGMATGFPAGYMARPRALQSGPPQPVPVASGTDATVAPAPLAPASVAPEAPTPEAPQAPQAPKAPKAPEAPKAPKAPEARLAPSSTTRPPRRPAQTATGVLAVESRPSGAAVTINGRPRGVTPLSLTALAPGEYQVSLALRGYQPFSTTVRVVEGERTRAAASLTGLTGQERE